jgi:hypothetical protein
MWKKDKARPVAKDWQALLLDRKAQILSQINRTLESERREAMVYLSAVVNAVYLAEDGTIAHYEPVWCPYGSMDDPFQSQGFLELDGYVDTDMPLLKFLQTEYTGLSIQDSDENEVWIYETYGEAVTFQLMDWTNDVTVRVLNAAAQELGIRKEAANLSLLEEMFREFFIASNAASYYQWEQFFQPEFLQTATVNDFLRIGKTYAGAFRIKAEQLFRDTGRVCEDNGGYYVWKQLPKIVGEGMVMPVQP